MTRTPQRQRCPVCDKSVAVLDGQALSSHLAPPVPGTTHTPRCPGGALPPTDGLIRPVVDETPAPRLIPADRTVNSVRTVRGGIPGAARR